MAIPGITITTVPSPVTLQVPADTTETLVSTYLLPFLTAAGVSAPSGSLISGFNFNLNVFNGTSTARISYSNIPASGSVGVRLRK